MTTSHDFSVSTSGQTPITRSHSAKSIPSLTGIRGVAALWVFLTHYQAVLAAYLHRPDIMENAFLYNGFRGVDLFFVLSGFILFHVHGEDFRTWREESFRNFYVLRFFRVYPLNTVVLIALLPIYFLLPDVVSWFRMDHGVPIPYHDHDFSEAGFVQSLFLAQTWTIIKPGEWNGPSWSLSAEVVGYGLFPLLAHFLMRRRSALACVLYALASLIVLMILMHLFRHAQDSPTGTFGLVRMLFAFVAGMSMARCFHLMPNAIWLGGPLALASMAFIAATISVPSLNIFVVFGFCGLIFAIAYQQGIIDAILSSRISMFLGKISFSFYMVHYVPLKISLMLAQTTFAESTLTVRIVCLVAAVGTCLALAMITYHYVEYPLQRFARAYLRRGRDRSQQAITAKAT